MVDDENGAEGQDDAAVARDMVARIDRAIDLAHAIGAERLALLLERAKDLAKEASAMPSASRH